MSKHRPPRLVRDDAAHPITVSVLELLRKLLVADEFATVKLLTSAAPAGVAIEDVIGVPLKSIELSSGAKQKAIGILGLLNAVLRQWGADEVALQLGDGGEITGFCAASYGPTIGADEETAVLDLPK